VVDDSGDDVGNATKDFPGLVRDPGWTTFTKPKRMLEKFDDRSFTTGTVQGESASTPKEDKWEVYQKITFQTDFTQGSGGWAYEGGCQDKAASGSFLNGYSDMDCKTMGADLNGMCNAKGLEGSKWEKYNASSECASRYVHLSYPGGSHFGGPGRASAFSLNEVEIFDENGAKITPVSVAGNTAYQDNVINGNLNDYMVAWDATPTYIEIDLGAEYDISAVLIHARFAMIDGFVGYYTGPLKTGTQCAAWDIEDAYSLQPLGPKALEVAKGPDDFLDLCCTCGGGEEVAADWLHEYGREYGENSAISSVNYGWRCPLDPGTLQGGSRTRRGIHDSSSLRGSYFWDTCLDGINNEWEIEVPYQGAYLVTLQYYRGTSLAYKALGIENVRSITDSIGGNSRGPHTADTTEILLVDVLDGKLTMSHFQRVAPWLRWMQIEKLVHGQDAPQTPSSTTWLPASSEEYWELKLEEADAPVGLVVLEVPGSMVMTPNPKYGANTYLPHFRKFSDDDPRLEWLFDPPGENLPRTTAFKFGSWQNLSSEVDEYGYPTWCVPPLYHVQHPH
jgi:hypothetical protein